MESTINGSQDEKLIPLAEARKLVPGNPSLSTLIRWCRQGYQGHRLRCERWGLRFFTKPQWVREFQEAVTNAPSIA